MARATGYFYPMRDTRTGQLWGYFNLRGGSIGAGHLPPGAVVFDDRRYTQDQAFDMVQAMTRDGATTDAEGTRWGPATGADGEHAGDPGPVPGPMPVGAVPPQAGADTAGPSHPVAAGPQVAEPPAADPMRPPAGAPTGVAGQGASSGPSGSSRFGEAGRYVGGVTDSVLQGLTFGFSDEIGAAGSLVGSTLKRWANGQELDIGGDYNRALEESRARLKGFEADYPWTSTIANVAGGFLMPGLGMARLATRAASLPGTIARTSTVGAGAGGLSGFGGGEGGIGARLEGAATGAVVGGALGGAAPVAATAGGRVVGAVADRTGSRARHAPTHASNSYGIFDPPELPPRPFSDDYPHRARRDGAGNLTHDIEGRPLRARPQRIAGRRVAEGPDEPIHWKEFDDIVKEGTGKPTKIEEIPEGDLGSTYYNVRTRRPTRVVIREGLPPDVAKRVHAHEIGHVIDQLARGIKIPTKNINDELEKVYHQLGDNTSRRLEDNVPRELMTLPEKTFGYSKKDAPRELWAEGIRAYMTNPSYFKHEAPRAAALIRKVVNRNPKISGIIQFNTMAPVALATGAAPMGLLDPYLGGAEPRNHQRSLLEFIANQDLDKMGR